MSLALSYPQRRRFERPPRQVFADPFPTPAARILRVTCTLFGITKAELVGERHLPLFVHARRYAAIRMRSELGASLCAIGRALNRDHSSIWHLLNPGKKKR